MTTTNPDPKTSSATEGGKFRACGGIAGEGEQMFCFEGRGQAGVEVKEREEKRELLGKYTFTN